MAEFNYNLNGYIKEDFFTGTIGPDGTIYSQSMTTGKIAIGLDNKAVQEMQNTITEMQSVIDNYYNKLVDLGEIVPEKTQEQIAQETAIQQQEFMRGVLDTMQSMKEELKELKANGNSRNIYAENSENTRQKPAGSPTSNKSSKKNVTKSSE